MPDDASCTPDDLDELDTSAFSLIVHYDPMMVAELALGAEDPYVIADRYGVDDVQFDHLAQQEWFGRLVAQKRHEFHDTGVLFTAKAGMMAEALLTRLFQQSMTGTIAAPLTVEVAKQLTEIGRLKPQPQNTLPGAGGTPFSINIQVNGTDVVAKSQPALTPHTLDVTPTPKPTGPDPALTLEFPAPKGVPPASISNIKVPDFDVRHPMAVQAIQASALTGAPVAQAVANAAAFGGPTAPIGLPTKPA